MLDELTFPSTWSNHLHSINYENWSQLDDLRLLDHISRYGENRWNLIAKKLDKSLWQCSDRYMNHLRSHMFGSHETVIPFGPQPFVDHPPHPNTDHHYHPVPWRKKEDAALGQLQIIHGSNWQLIANRLTLLNESDGLYLKRSALEVQQRFRTISRIQQQQQQQSNKENIMDSNTFRDSLLSWSNFSKRNDNNTNKSWLNSDKTFPDPHYLKTNNNMNWSSRRSIFKHESEEQKSNDSTRSKFGSFRNSHDTSLSSLPSVRTTNRPSSLLQRDLLKRIKPSSFVRSFQTPSSSTPSFGSSHSTRTSPITCHKIHPTAHILPLDDPFTVQTPTKALSEADQLSFHLVSPPAVIGNLVNASHGGRLAGMKQDADNSLMRTPTRRRFVDSGPRGLCTRLFDDATYPPPAPLPTSRSTMSSLKSLSSSSDDSKCLAYLTAKATVWSRALLPLQPNTTNHSNNNVNSTINQTNRMNHVMPSNRFQSSSLSSSAVTMPSMHWTNFCNLRTTTSSLGEPCLKPLQPLGYSSRQQPQLSWRRVIQVGYEDDWREFAFGDSRICQSLIDQADSIIHSNNNQSTDCDEPMLVKKEEEQSDSAATSCQQSAVNHRAESHDDDVFSVANSNSDDSNARRESTSPVVGRTNDELDDFAFISQELTDFGYSICHQDGDDDGDRQVADVLQMEEFDTELVSLL